MGKSSLIKTPSLEVGIKGFFKFESVNPHTGRRTLLADWFPNSILNEGRNIMASFSNWAGSGSKCQVGTAGVPIPAVTDTQLVGYVAGTDTIVEHTWGAQNSPPYYAWDRSTYRFEGGLDGDILSEAGVGWGTVGATLISRALIVDEFGTPTPVTVLADEWLDVTYELRYYPPLADSLGTVVLDGVTYNTITRAANVTSWGTLIGGGSAIGRQFGVSGSFPDSWRVYDGNIGDITQSPNGVWADNDAVNWSNRAYSNNSYSLVMDGFGGLAGWNLAGGIRSIHFKTIFGSFQTQFNGPADAKIPKNGSNQIAFAWRMGWNEQVIP